MHPPFPSLSPVFLFQKEERETGTQTETGLLIPAYGQGVATRNPEVG